MKAIDRRRPVPVSTNDPKDVLFFDTMWADPQTTEGFGSSAARGAGCVSFGPDVTRRFCEINRLRMIVRSHEVPKTMTGVQAHPRARAPFALLSPSFRPPFALLAPFLCPHRCSQGVLPTIFPQSAPPGAARWAAHHRLLGLQLLRSDRQHRRDDDLVASGERPCTARYTHLAQLVASACAPLIPPTPFPSLPLTARLPVDGALGPFARGASGHGAGGSGGGGGGESAGGTAGAAEPLLRRGGRDDAGGCAAEDEGARGAAQGQARRLPRGAGVLAMAVLA